MSTHVVKSPHTVMTTHQGRVNQNIRTSLVQITACCLVGTKPLLGPMLWCWKLGSKFSEIWVKIQMSFCVLQNHSTWYGLIHNEIYLIPSYLIFSDVNECESGNGGCEHHCFNTDGSYHCMCRDGVKLRSDKHRCDGKSTIFFNLIVYYFFVIRGCKSLYV